MKKSEASCEDVAGGDIILKLTTHERADTNSVLDFGEGASASELRMFRRLGHPIKARSP